MTGSPLRKKISTEQIEALRSEYNSITRGGRDHRELVCYSYRPEPVVRIPAYQIVTVLKRDLSETTFDYHVLHIIEGEDQVRTFMEDVLKRHAEDLIEVPPILLMFTKVKTLPESFFQDFPLFRGFSRALKTFERREAVLSLSDPDHRSNKPKVHVLLSEKSGTGLANDFYKFVLENFLEVLLGLKEGIDFDVHRTTDPRDTVTRNFARDVLLPAANEGKKRTVILCSGDGGIVDLLNGPLRQCARESTYVAPTICLIPLGTGNALFHSLHRPLRNSPKPFGTAIVNSLRTLLYGYSHPLPTFTATFSPGARVLVNESRDAIPFPPSPNSNRANLNVLYGAVVASYGFHATLVADSDTVEYRKHGDKRFGMAARELMDDAKGGPHAYKCRVTANFLAESVRNLENILTGGTTEFGYILCTLISNLEEGFTISPKSKPMDGVLRTVCFGNLSGENVGKIMGLGYQDGKHVEDESVTYEPINDLRIDIEEKGTEWKWRRCCVDGQIVAIEEGGWMEVKNGGLGSELFEVLVPAV